MSPAFLTQETSYFKAQNSRLFTEILKHPRLFKVKSLNRNVKFEL